MFRERFLKEALKNRQKKGILRSLSLNHSATKVDFASNDYLGISRRGPFCQKTNFSIQCTKGSTGSRLLTGNSSAHEKLEEEIAKFHKVESALVCNSGYAANVGLISCIASPKDRILYDIQVHSSIIDGIKLSRAKAFPFRHNDVSHLKNRLNKKYPGNTFVCTETLFSMDGSLAPIKEITEACLENEALLIVDEAHSGGVYGKYGEGIVSSLGLQESVFATIYTYGKAFGIFGASIAGSSLLKEYLVNFCRPLVYSTSLPPLVIEEIRHAYRCIQKASEDRSYLNSLITYFQELTEKYQLQRAFPSQTCIQPLLFPGAHNAKRASSLCQKAGFDVRPILSPTVQKNHEILRVCLHSFNTLQEVTLLLELLNSVNKIT
ncbi:aminotransferase class I/II-fold pyridoxal phosphate-dependent enzyme [Chlamydiifrater phoenicopteri]|uniref:aminotransferase class I/II-fold pyridoxal phosphate-dependent enzyme n=1 Tax=Chlamydiifrater phoenicopteri TaxID=2681469 RepID=UPI001BD0F97F|nr:pyridoxal phosphate-dependent aminotransferase family protein [Chlamydiifrater phoenicopteri]